MTRLDDELTEINEIIVDPSKLKLTTENFLNLEIDQQKKRFFTDIKNRSKL